MPVRRDFLARFPRLGRPLVRGAPKNSHGVAIGVYTASFDVTLGLRCPALDARAGFAGPISVLLAGAAADMLAMPCAIMMLYKKRSPDRA